LWDFDDFKTCEQLVSWIKAKVCIATSWKPGASRTEAHSVEMQELDEQGQQELAALSLDADQEEVNAIYRRGQQRFAQKKWPSQRPGGGGARPAVRAPARTEGQMTCPSCLEMGHTKDDCDKPKVELDKRKCFLCKKEGHRAFQCPTKSARPANSVEDAKVKTAFCVEDSEGFVAIQRRRCSSSFVCSPTASVGPTKIRSQAVTTTTTRPRQPVPKERRLADFVKVANKFEALSQEPVMFVETKNSSSRSTTSTTTIRTPATTPTLRPRLPRTQRPQRSRRHDGRRRTAAPAKPQPSRRLWLR